VDAAEKVTGETLGELRVDGGMTSDELLMQIQADVLGIPVMRPAVTETTALGAAFAAGLAVGFWDGERELRSLVREDRRWEPQMESGVREREYAQWRKAVERSLDWTD
jgi:glycerol kinase